MSRFNLNLDDFSPHPKAGGDFKVIDTCNKLIDAYPEIKINLFVPAAYCRLGEKPYKLSENPEWVDKVKALPDNYMICYHGYHHRRFAGDFKFHTKPASNNDEWQYLSRGQAVELIGLMDEEFSGRLSRARCFRPPGWKVSQDALQALVNSSFTIAGDKKCFDQYKDKVKGLRERWAASYNWDLTSPCKVKGDVIAYGHTSDWTSNYFDNKKLEWTLKLLDSRDFDFKFIEEF